MNLSSQNSNAMDYVAWAKRVNARWIVHHDLNRSAESYLTHLEEVDQPRLVASCRNAYVLTQPIQTEDPKPWFYAGLFSLATAQESAQFLATHWLTKIVTDTTGPGVAPDRVSDVTLKKIEQIQAALAKLPTPPRAVMPTGL